MSSHIKIFRSKHEGDLEAKYNKWASEKPILVISDKQLVTNGSELILMVGYSGFTQSRGVNPICAQENIAGSSLINQVDLSLPKDCPECAGSGEYSGAVCASCSGWGHVESKEGSDGI